MKLSKEQAASRQLDTAIDLFFNGGDPVSVHTLAEAASEILRKLVSRLGKKSIRDHVVDTYDGGQRNAIDALSLAKNFIKHADRDPFGSLDFNEEINDGSIIMAIEDYRTCISLHKTGGSTLSIPMTVFEMWFYAQNPNLLVVTPNSKEQRFLDQATNLFPTLNSQPRFQRLAIGASVLRQQKVAPKN
ncbi:MAG: hypothetical protein NUV50_13720 [Rhodospirillales bacterium]|nr:hypothetical protein [Rhodospirillales bacterium]